MVQNADGTPHFTYFDYDTQLSFIWDGKSDHIEVSHGGYGEPVMDAIQINRLAEATITNAQAWLIWFRSYCELYIEARARHA